MRRGKTISYQLALSAILLAVSVALLVGVTWARYQAGEEFYLEYGAKEYPGLHLWSFDGNGGLSETDAVWEVSEGNRRTLRFCITNGIGVEDAAQENQQVYIRVLAGLGLPDETVLTLMLDGEETVYTATAQSIKEGTLLYQNFGAGYSFSFLDEDGSERSWLLEGGGLSSITAQLSVEGEIDDTILLLLQVRGELTH